MSTFFLLSNVVCPALPTSGSEDGHPDAFSYVENLAKTGGDSGTKLKTTGEDCCRVPDDNGDSWTVADANDAARGAFLYLEVIGPVNMKEVNDRLTQAKANQARVMKESQNQGEVI